jgi:sulfonate transport system substrate-binding protein
VKNIENKNGNAIKAAVVLIAFAAALFFAASAFAADGQNQAKVIRVGWQGASQLKNINESQGFFEKEFGPDGITVEFSQFAYGPPIVEGLATDSLDFGLDLGDMPITTALANKIPIKAILKVPYDPNNDERLLVPIDSSVEKPADLKGKKVAAPVGSSAHHFLILSVASAGLAEDDVEIVNLAPTDLETALATGQIDAVSIWEPYVAIIEANKHGREIETPKGLRKSLAIIAGRNAFTEQNPEITARFLKVALQIYGFVHEDRERAIKIIAEHSGFKESDLRPSIQAQIFDPYFLDDDWAQAEKTKQFLLKSDVIENDFDVKTLFTDKYLVEAEKLFKESGKK